jgi:hypothetical protein
MGEGGATKRQLEHNSWKGESNIGEKMPQVAEETRILKIRLLVCGWRMRLRRVLASYYASGDAAYRNVDATTWQSEHNGGGATKWQLEHNSWKGESNIGEKMQQVAEETRISRIRLLVYGWRMRLRRVPASYYASGDTAYRNASSRPPRIRISAIITCFRQCS